MSIAWYFSHPIPIVQKISAEYISIRYFINLSKDITWLLPPQCGPFVGIFASCDVKIKGLSPYICLNPAFIPSYC